jgi:hypothetical protein
VYYTYLGKLNLILLIQFLAQPNIIFQVTVSSYLTVFIMPILICPKATTTSLCATMTSSVDVIDPPTEVTLVPCTNQARYFCAKQIPGTIHNLDRFFLTLNNGFKKGNFTFFQLYKIY